MPKITIYSTPTCHYCHAAKDFFTKNGFEYTDIDVSKDSLAREEVVLLSGQLGVPVIVVDDELVVGFKEPQMRELLKIEG